MFLVQVTYITPRKMFGRDLWHQVKKNLPIKENQNAEGHFEKRNVKQQEIQGLLRVDRLFFLAVIFKNKTRNASNCECVLRIHVQSKYYFQRYFWIKNVNFYREPCDGFNSDVTTFYMYLTCSFIIPCYLFNNTHFSI